MRGMVRNSIVLFGAVALALPAAAQQAGPPPGAAAPRPAGAPPGSPRARPAPPPPNTGIALSAALSGRGSGYLGAVIDPPSGQICYILDVANTDPPTMAHIHVGGPGQNGAPVVPLEAPTGGSSGSCQPISADLAQAILRNPGGYYVNVHTAAQPGGAIRGQLSR